MSDGGSLINLGELSKPATTLIEKISDAVGGIFRPGQIRRIAQAEADAALIATKAEIEITDMHRRAMVRFIQEEGQRQENIESITAQAIPLLEDEANPAEIQDDWIVNFFDKCRLISDKDMQLLWAKVLAGEANLPGSFSKRTVSALGMLDKRDAALFETLCTFTWVMDYAFPYVYSFDGSPYDELGLDFDGLTHLDDIGLIKYEDFFMFSHKVHGKIATVSYFGRRFQIQFEKDGLNKLETGRAVFTKVGEELVQVVGAKPDEHAFNHVFDLLNRDARLTVTPLVNS